MFRSILIIALVTSCNLIDFNDNGFIDPEIKPYVDSFVHEANLRGIHINTDHLKISFKNLKEAQGITYRSTEKIFIDQRSIGWDIEPECLVFHELSHLYLKRNHDNSKINGYSKSIMDGNGSPSFRNPDYGYRRDYYINELFDANTQPPDWAR